MSNKPLVAVPDIRNTYRRPSTAPSQVQVHRHSPDYDTGAVTRSLQKDQKVDSIVQKTFFVPRNTSDDNTIRRLSMDNLTQEQELLHIIRKDDGTVRCGNDKGLSTLDQFEELFKRFSELETSLRTQRQDYDARFKAQTQEIDARFKAHKQEYDARFETQSEEHEAKFKSQEAINRDLVAKIAEYDEKWKDQAIINGEAFKARKRWFANYIKRNRHDVFDNQERQAIMEGDEAVHSGKPVMDAVMQKQQQRKADNVYQELYGMIWEDVLTIQDDKQAIEVLTIYATTKATRGYSVPSFYTSRFEAFVNAFQHQSESQATAEVYDQFHRAHLNIEQRLIRKGFSEDFIAKFDQWVPWRQQQAEVHHQQVEDEPQQVEDKPRRVEDEPQQVQGQHQPAPEQ